MKTPTHAPHAPGPRPDTWHKQQFNRRHPEFLDIKSPQDLTIHTRPRAAKQKLGDRSYHPAMMKKIGRGRSQRFEGKL